MIVDALNARSVVLRRIVAVAAIPLALAIVWALIVWPAVTLYDAQVEWRSKAARQLAHARGLLAIEPQLRQRLDTLPTAAEWQRFYRVTTPGNGLMELQTDVSNALAMAKGRPLSLNPLPSSAAGPLRKVGLRVSSAMRIDELRAFLAQMQGSPRLLRIERFMVNAPPTQTPQENPTLTVTMDIFGFEIDAETKT